MKKIRENDCNLEKILNENLGVTSYGSEFKNVNELEYLLGKHPRWNELKENPKEGACFPIEEIDESTRLQVRNEEKR